MPALEYFISERHIKISEHIGLPIEYEHHFEASLLIVLFEDRIQLADAMLGAVYCLLHEIYDLEVHVLFIRSG